MGGSKFALPRRNRMNKLTAAACAALCTAALLPQMAMGQEGPDLKYLNTQLPVVDVHRCNDTVRDKNGVIHLPYFDKSGTLQEFTIIDGAVKQRKRGKWVKPQDLSTTEALQLSVKFEQMQSLCRGKDLLESVVDDHYFNTSILLKFGTEMNFVSNAHMYSPLMLAAENGNVPIMELLLANGALLNATNADGENALIAAVKGGHAKAVEFLLKQKGIKLDQRTFDKDQTALEIAQEKTKLSGQQRPSFYVPAGDYVLNSEGALERSEGAYYTSSYPEYPEGEQIVKLLGKAIKKCRNYRG